ncbi:MAG: hypothetical protein ABIL06_20260, partial [Pseudomonadota bacterium]
QFFGIELEWWRKGEPAYIPEFMIKAVGVTRQRAYSFHEIEKTVLDSLMADRVRILERTFESDSDRSIDQ